MYILVQFIEDGILHVSHLSDLKRNKKKFFAKYFDGHYYICKVICRNNKKNILEKIEKNLRLKVPIVLLDQLDFICQKESIVESQNVIVRYENTVKNSGPQCQPDYNKKINELQQVNDHKKNCGLDTEELIVESQNVMEGYENTVENSVPQCQSDYNKEINVLQQVNDHKKNCGLDTEESVVESQIINEIYENTVESSRPQCQSYDNEEINELQQVSDQKKNYGLNNEKTINIHQIVHLKWHDCIINPSNEYDVHNIVFPQDENNNSTSAGTSTTDTAKTHKSSHKRHACFYCKKTVFQISRHLLNVHAKETEVLEIKQLNANNPLRKSKLNLLRNKGDFEYNKFHNNNIVVRKSIKAVTDDLVTQKYVPCPSCLGFFVKDNLRHHKSRCSPHKGDRQLQGNARKLLNHVHDRASDKLRNCVIPHMFHDEITNNVLFDEILVLYGNYLCVKYTQDHLKNHVRAQLRLLGRLIIQAKVHNSSITCCKDLMQSIHCDIIRKAIDDVAELDPIRGIYKHPFNARTLGTAIQKILGVLKSESIKKQDDEQLKICEAFLQVYKIDIAPYLNRICSLSEKKQKRIKFQQVKLPENDEIQKYFKYLLEHAAFHEQQLQDKFSVKDWKSLAQYLLVALAVFNRKRPGEIQRLELEDFYRRRHLSQKELDSLEPHDQLQADKYVRVGFGGKLGNSTALLIDKEKILPGLLVMLKYRNRAGVHMNNQFLFGAPSTDENRTFSTYASHQLFLSKSGMRSNSLSFTNLRYHLATEVSKGGSTQEEELRVSNYMSHDYSIHKSIYDQSAVVMDITKVSKHLKTSTTVNKRKQSSRPTSVSTDREDFSNYGNQHYPKRKKKLENDNEFNPDFSLSSNDEPDVTEVERCLGKLQCRIPWTSVEKCIARKYFKEELDGKELISSEKVKAFKAKYPDVLKKRTVPMIKQWIEMEKNKIYRITLGILETRPRYSTPERELLESSTEHHSLSGSEPSLQELEELIHNNPILNKRSASSLLGKFKQIHRRKITVILKKESVIFLSLV